MASVPDKMRSRAIEETGNACNASKMQARRNYEKVIGRMLPTGDATRDRRGKSYDPMRTLHCGNSTQKGTRVAKHLCGPDNISALRA
jgi:hypothetical protein